MGDELCGDPETSHEMLDRSLGFCWWQWDSELSLGSASALAKVVTSPELQELQVTAVS